jgi:hypothetical protein
VVLPKRTPQKEPHQKKRVLSGFPKRTRFFSLTFFVSTFYRFGCFSVRGIKKHHTNIFTKSPCRKLFPNKSTKNPKPIFSILFYHVFWAFLGGGFKNAKTISPKTSDPGPFLASDPLIPTHHGATDYFWRPLLAAREVQKHKTPPKT